jgi:hypothetical protein
MPRVPPNRPPRGLKRRNVRGPPVRPLMPWRDSNCLASAGVSIQTPKVSDGANGAEQREENMRTNPLFLSIVAALSACAEETFDAQGCISATADQTSCPPAGAVRTKDVWLPGRCGDDLEVTAVKSGGTLESIVGQDGSSTPACCYIVEVTDHDESAECVVGRPYYDDGAARRAPLLADVVHPRSADRSSHTSRVHSSDDFDALRAAAWANAGAAEHASVAAFSRLALQLMALGAPNELVRDAHQAALDEIGHAELCWRLARDLGGAHVSAGPFPFQAPVALDVQLAEFAAVTAREGCLEETLGAHVAAIAATLASDTGVRNALQTIATEEAAHAVLSFRIVAWALRVGGPEVRAAVQAAFTGACLPLNLAELALRTQIDISSLREAAHVGISEVLDPACARLLSA